LDLSEIWLGESQSLGSFEQGARTTILDVARNYGINVRILPRINLKNKNGRARSLLIEGRIVEGAKLAGSFPIWKKPRSRILKLAWKPGNYRVVSLAEPNKRITNMAFAVRLHATKDGMAVLEWPDQEIKCIEFVSGPADE